VSKPNRATASESDKKRLVAGQVLGRKHRAERCICTTISKLCCTLYHISSGAKVVKEVLGVLTPRTVVDPVILLTDALSKP
jgi:hypothetical protein